MRPSAAMVRLAAEPDQWPRQIHKIRNASFSKEFSQTFPPMAHEGSWVVAATSAFRIVGYAWVVPTVIDEGTCYLEEVAVSERLRGGGIGTAMVQEAARWMHDRGFRRMLATSLRDRWQEPRETWLARLGFLPHQYGGHALDLTAPGTDVAHG